MTIEKHAFVVFNGDCFKLIQDAQRLELPTGVRQQGDAHANLPDLGHRFKDLAIHSPGVQIQRQAQTCNAAPNDGDFHERPRSIRQVSLRVFAVDRQRYRTHGENLS